MVVTITGRVLQAVVRPPASAGQSSLGNGQPGLGTASDNRALVTISRRTHLRPHPCAGVDGSVEPAVKGHWAPRPIRAARRRRPGASGPPPRGRPRPGIGVPRNTVLVWLPVLLTAKPAYDGMPDNSEPICHAEPHPCRSPEPACTPPEGPPEGPRSPPPPVRRRACRCSTPVASGDAAAAAKAVRLLCPTAGRRSCFGPRPGDRGYRRYKCVETTCGSQARAWGNRGLGCAKGAGPLDG